MASVKSAGYFAPQMMPVDGRAVFITDTGSMAANPTANDTLDFLLPAGIELAVLRFNVSDMDTGTALAAKIGYAPVDPNSSLAASDAYFKAAGAFGQTAGLVDCAFAPIKFEEDVRVTVTWTVAAGTFVAGTVNMIAGGNAKGPR